MKMFNLNIMTSQNKYEKLMLFISGFMLLFLLVLSYFHKMGSYGVETDFYWSYAPDAQNILNGQLPEEPGVGPGYALVLAFLNIFLNNWFLSGKLISIISAILCGIFTFKIVQSFFNDRIALYTIILWHVTVLPFSIIASTDMFFAFLVSAAIYYLFKNKRIETVNLVGSALIFGYAYLTRPNAIILPICVVFIIIFINPDSLKWPQRLKSLLIFGVTFFIVLSPWLLVLFNSTGKPVRSDSYLIIASHFYGRPGVIGSEDMRLAAQKFDSLKSVVFYDFTYFVKHYIFNIYHHLYDVLIKSLKFPSFLFVGAGAILLLPKLNKKQLSFFTFPVFSFLMLCLVHYEPRYYLYFISYFVLLAVYFLIDGSQGEAINDKKQKKYHLKETVFGITVVFLLIFSIKEIKHTINAEPRELIEISKYLRQNVGENESIIARKPHLGFLSNLKTVYFPEVRTLTELLDYAANEKVNYVLYGEEESKRRPDLKLLLEPDKIPGAFEPFYIWENPRTVIYKLRI